jgi:chemotaxis protein methyltransferase WspC
MRSISTNSVDSKSVFHSGSKSENPSESLDSQMTTIQQWADEGRIVQAQQKLSELLSRNSGSAENWCLLGMLHENLLAVREAEACYQKALYLDATCYDALVHLAFLAEQRRDTDQAARLRSRAKRVLSVFKGDPV